MLDHPRACGANKYTSSAFSPVPGSSPRVRGKRVPGTRPPVFVRSIPAHAGQTVSPRIQTTCPSDHPRACGANIEHLERQQRKYGSSPRVRGKLRGQPKPASPHRIIPARAGQTLSSFLRMCWDSDHPRACGANASYGYRGGCLRGSSPRVRGKQREGAELRLSGRIIPARAGQTARRSTRRRTSPDHPRACGANAAIGGGILASDHPRACGANSSSRCVADCSTGSSPRAGQTNSTSNWMCGKADHPRACGANSGLTYLVPSVAGSSPRVRGKRILGSLLRVGCRIIPARAGQTRCRRPVCSRCPDHPRACGANWHTRAVADGLYGSSPRVRGKHVVEADGDSAIGIIPARAGQTRPPHTDWLSRPDHPRACGANYLTALIVFIAIGSSPRVRGKPRGLAAGQRGGRIIPARAGQTVWGGQRGASRADHPRACGANSSASAVTVTLPGSSPRVRGKQRASRQPDEHVRIIPARAGQTRWCREYRIPKPDHPRACGANLSTSSNSNSSAWIIPARAGQTRMPKPTRRTIPDHPRACGANSSLAVLSCKAVGSSQRVRGKRSVRFGRSRVGRIIPARAGQTRRYLFSVPVSSDHPRACGANPAGRARV